MMVSYRDMYFDCEALEDIAIKLKNKITAISVCYNEIKTRTKDLSGTNDIWQGNDQKKYYSALEMITDKYEKNIEKLVEIYNFLRKTIEAYRSKDQQLEKTLDDNADNLDM